MFNPSVSPFLESTNRTKHACCWIVGENMQFLEKKWNKMRIKPRCCDATAETMAEPCFIV